MDRTAPALQQRTSPFAALGRLSMTQAAALLVVIALTLRAIHLPSRPLWLDEAYSAWFSGRSWHDLWNVVPTYEPHPPFYYSVLKAWRSLMGGDALALRGLSVLLGSATVPAVMAAAVQLERLRPTGRPLLAVTAAGFLAAASPMFVLLDQEARPYALMIFAYAVAILGLLRLTREFAGGHPGTWSSWLLLAAGTEVALWSHGLGLIFAACLALALAPAWLAGPFDRQRIVRGTAAAAAVALVYAPCLAMMLGRVDDWGTGWLDWRPLMIVQTLALYTVPFEVLTVSAAVAAVAMLLLAKRAVQSAVAPRAWNPDSALLVLWLAPPLVAAFVSQLGVPIFLLRTLSLALVPFYLAIGAALARSASRQERVILGAAVAIPLVVAAVQVAVRPPSERWDEVRLFLDRNVGASDQVWLYPNDSALPLDAAGPHSYARRAIPGDYPAIGFKGPIRAGSPAVVSLTRDQAQALASDPRLRRTPVIWLVARQPGLFDPQGELRSALARARVPGKPQHWDYISVEPYYVRGK